MNESETSIDPRGGAVRRALADERRIALVAVLRQDDNGLDVQALGERLGVHPNTVRWHLGVLADAGLVDSRPAGTRGPGRPRIVYRLRPEAATGESDEHRVLATILTEAVAALEDAPDKAEAAGRAWGRHVMGSREGAARHDRDRALEEIVELLAVQGFAPVAADNSIFMRRCPFHDLAEAHPEIVCAVHRGLVAGALTELEAPLQVSELRPFVEPSLCVLQLESRTELSD